MARLLKKGVQAQFMPMDSLLMNTVRTLVSLMGVTHGGMIVANGNTKRVFRRILVISLSYLSINETLVLRAENETS